MKWICENDCITDDIIYSIEKKLKIKFAEDFVFTIRQYNGGYPIPNRIMIDGQEEILNNLVSFIEDDPSYILDIFNYTEGFCSHDFVPIAEEPFGNLFCYSLGDVQNIYFWEHETNCIKFVCKSFTELLDLLH